jgi:DNA-binding NarL/FixJ family response regulator
MAMGDEYKAIAAALGVSVRTVHKHVNAIADALPGASKPQLRVCLYAVRWYVEAHAVPFQQAA